MPAQPTSHTLWLPGLPWTRGAKSGGTGEPGSQKVNQTAESFGGQEDKLSKPSLQKNDTD